MEIKCTPQELKELLTNKTSVAETTDEKINIALAGKTICKENHD